MTRPELKQLIREELDFYNKKQVDDFIHEIRNFVQQLDSNSEIDYFIQQIKKEIINRY